MKCDPSKWYRKKCRYEVWIGPNSLKWHFFWLPTVQIARAWAFYRRDMNGEPDLEISMKECIERGYKKRAEGEK